MGPGSRSQRSLGRDDHRSIEPAAAQRPARGVPTTPRAADALRSIDPAAAQRAAGEVPSIPRDADGPVFREPWEAQAFAMTLALHERGLFTWEEWAAALASAIKRAQAAGDPDTGETYYRHWLAALERLVGEKEIATPDILA